MPHSSEIPHYPPQLNTATNYRSHDAEVTCPVSIPSGIEDVSHSSLYLCGVQSLVHNRHQRLAEY